MNKCNRIGHEIDEIFRFRLLRFFEQGNGLDYESTW